MKAVVRHLLARGHFTQMGNSLLCLPTGKMYNPRWKQRNEIANGVLPLLSKQGQSLNKNEKLHPVCGKPY